VVNGAPQIHTPWAVGLPDGEVRGGICCKPSRGQPWNIFHTYPTTLSKTRRGNGLFLFDLKRDTAKGSMNHGNK